MSSAIITVEGLGKKYRIQHQQQGQRYVALRDVIAQKFAAPFRFLRRSQKSEVRPLISTLRPPPSAPASQEDFWALKDVSFEVKQGEVVGIIGRNGAGKSTLLKILSRITEPTEGRVHIKGRVASLLEVGTGFHAELTGRENIFLNGAILGMSRMEIKRKFDEIVAFAEVEKFLDTPVKRYSSGMYVRLAFAVAAHLEPEILIVDEVLAVGDAEFQKKCLGKMESVSRSEGRTVLFVSHNMQAIRNLAPQSVLLDKGMVVFGGDTKTAVEKYLYRDGSSEVWEYDTANLPRRNQGSGLALIEKVWFPTRNARIYFGESFRVRIQLSVNERLSGVSFDITFFDTDSDPVGTSFSPILAELAPGKSRIYELTIPNLRFAPGKYHCDVCLLKGHWLHSPRVHDVALGVLQFEVEFPQSGDGTAPVWHGNWGASVPEDISVSVVQSVN
jgi:lipopolysaccharide transport system ATP-binding protein